jgi:hypothetical protein
VKSSKKQQEIPIIAVVINMFRLAQILNIILFGVQTARPVKRNFPAGSEIMSGSDAAEHPVAQIRLKKFS